MKDVLLASLVEVTQAANRLPDVDEFGYKAAMEPEWGEAVAKVSRDIQSLLGIVTSSAADDDDDDEGDLDATFGNVHEYVESLLEDVDGLLLRRPTPALASSSSSSSKYTRDALKKLEKPSPFAFFPSRDDVFVPKPWDGRRVPENGEHPFDEELRNLSYSVDQLKTPPARPPPADHTSELVYVDTKESVAEMGRALEGARDLAIDVEHHSWRSFHGLTCLIQLSRRAPAIDFVVDVLAVRRQISKVLGPLLCNPNIVKVMHGVDNDVIWLERDFGLYFVNLFDTGIAADRLGYPQKSLSYLLERHVEALAIDSFTKKTLQRADWRRRPLDPQMLAYARQDTQHLLRIYDKLRIELGGPEGTRAILDASARKCRRRFQLTPFDPEGYRTLTNSYASREDAAVARALWDWRDSTARACDESLGYVLPVEKLLAMARIKPTSPERVARIGGFMPAHEDRDTNWAQQIADTIDRAVSSEVEKPSSSMQAEEASDDEEEEDDDVFDAVAAPAIVVKPDPAKMLYVFVNAPATPAIPSLPSLSEDSSDGLLAPKCWEGWGDMPPEKSATAWPIWHKIASKAVGAPPRKPKVADASISGLTKAPAASDVVRAELNKKRPLPPPAAPPASEQPKQEQPVSIAEEYRSKKKAKRRKRAGK